MCFCGCSPCRQDPVGLLVAFVECPFNDIFTAYPDKDGRNDEKNHQSLHHWKAYSYSCGCSRTNLDILRNFPFTEKIFLAGQSPNHGPGIN